LITLIRQATGQPLFSSNSIYGILDLLLMNWANDQDFQLVFDQAASTITVNGVIYLLEWYDLAGNQRGEVLINE
jgi:hypothetical protein